MNATGYIPFYDFDEWCRLLLVNWTYSSIMSALRICSGSEYKEYMIRRLDEMMGRAARRSRNTEW